MVDEVLDRVRRVAGMWCLNLYTSPANSIQTIAPLCRASYSSIPLAVAQAPASVLFYRRN